MTSDDSAGSGLPPRQSARRTGSPDGKLNVLIVGGGGREHALYLASVQSRLAARVICTPGNGGIPAANRRSVEASNFPGLLSLAEAEAIDFVVIGPEFPLVHGLVEAFAAAGIAAFGPSAAAARLEGSKSFAKALCKEMAIPTARYEVAETLEEAELTISRWGAPIVLKADGLCAGKGVTVAATVPEALQAARNALVEDAFGPAGRALVIEECLVGPECSVVAICDGANAVLLPPARDYKRAFDGDTGPNTGGMGAYAPLPDLDENLLEEIKRSVIMPVLCGMAERKTPYHGALYVGLMLTEAGPKVIEFNCRFGDPETQVTLPLVRSDLLEVMLAAVEPGGLSQVSELAFSQGASVSVVLATAEYPYPGPTGIPIKIPEEAEREALVLHAGTRDAGGLFTAGGRVLNVVGSGPTHAVARARAYSAASRITFEGKRFRTDIAAHLGRLDYADSLPR